MVISKYLKLPKCDLLKNKWERAFLKCNIPSMEYVGKEDYVFSKYFLLPNCLGFFLLFPMALSLINRLLFFLNTLVKF